MYFLRDYDPLLLLQSDESDESTEEESATDNGEKCLSDGKKKVHFCIPRKCKQ